MKKIIVILMFFIAILSTLSCSKKSIKRPEKIIIEKIKTENEDFEVIKTVTEKEEINEYFRIIEKTKWEKGKIKVSMARKEDFKLNEYSLWITPSGNMFEIVNNKESKYGKLSKGFSSELHKLITEKKLGE